MSKYDTICVKINSKENTGSGFLIKSPNNYYAITSFHCIGDEKKMELNSDIKIQGNKENEVIEFYFEQSNIKFFPHVDEELNIDLAIIPLLEKVKIIGEVNREENIEKYVSKKLVIDTSINSETNPNLIGFPINKRDEKNPSLEREYIKIEGYKFNKDIGTFTKSNIYHDGGQSFDERLDGFSGSGIFLETESLILLQGIFNTHNKRKSLGNAISPMKLRELFKISDLEVPPTLDSFFQLKLEEILTNLIEEERKEDPSLFSMFEEFKEKIILERYNIEKIIKGLSIESFHNQKEKYLELFIEKLYLLEYFKKTYSLNKNTLSIDLEKMSAKLFKSNYDKYPKIKAEFIRYIYDSRIKINQGDNIYVKDIADYDEGDFNCENCCYLMEKDEQFIEKDINTKILNNYVSTSKESNSFNIIEGKNRKELIIRCADCISTGKKKKLEKREGKLWG